MNIKRNLVLIAAALLLVCGFFLPNAVASVTDSGRLGNITMIDSESVTFDPTPTLSLPERIALMANPNAELIGWKSGNVMDELAAERKAMLELNKFLHDGPFSFDFRGYTTQESSAIFIIDSETPTASMVVWELTIADTAESTVTVTIDDETGVILKIILKQARRVEDAGSAADAPEELYVDASRLVEKMAEYYGLQIILGDYAAGNNGSYYRADVLMHGADITMFGVVRATGFTMNERRAVKS